ncbi:hypothetical protein BV898_01649 [Hypsibius exemplaris]|uniref:Spaetzle domain-containing protein n=1 Tax=Hypsibius exemplaris TaxID=2072580 RepID=A0A1W0XAM8_HYPEX|nr:hypothetical protein BV898_01649 [Hypsibius exemplaris]
MSVIPVLLLVSSGVLAHVVFAGDDGEYYPFFNPVFQQPILSPSHRSQRMRFIPPDDDRIIARPSGYKKHGQLSPAIGAQPPFLFPGFTPVTFPSCAEGPSFAYCLTDSQYPTDLIASCIENDPETFKRLRNQVLWSCDVFPELEAPVMTEFPLEVQEEVTTESSVIPVPAEEPATTEQEVLQPMRVGGIPARGRAVQPVRPPMRERLTKAAAKAPLRVRPVVAGVASPRTKTAPSRRTRRDDTSGLQFLTQQRVAMNHSYEVCSSAVRNDLGIVRAESELGEWGWLVQTGECKQIVRSEECITVGEPCAYLCSSLKSQCTQRYSLQRLLTCTAERGLHLDWYRIPASCGCQVQFAGHTAQHTTTADPLGD